MALADDVIGALQAAAKPDGVRVSELCRGLPGVTPHEVESALQQLLRLGQVRRNDLKGTWRLSGATASTPPTPPAPGAGRTSSPKGADPRPRDSALPAVEDHGIPSECDDEGVIDASQRAVIREAVSSRQVVIAGPGFGKTAVACGRVAWLLRQGVEPVHILLLSFTRTAVREMRARIAELAKGVADAVAVEVRTIDSFMWRLRTGFEETPSAAKGYADSIKATATLLDAPTPDAQNYLAGFQHVLVDEAQDLVGERATLVARMLQKLRPETGWTVFFDPAQAIYDWSDDERGNGAPPADFADLLAKLSPPPLTRDLRHLHRTRDPALRALLLGARRLVLDSPSDACARLRATLEARAEGNELPVTTAHEVFQTSGWTTDATLALLRRRAEVMELSCQLSQGGVAHRLRVGGLPHPGAPWVAAVLNEACRVTGELVVTEAEVCDAWATVDAANPWLLAGWDVGGAWRLLRRLGAGKRKGTVDIARVADRLASENLPDEISRRELGDAGPIVSTVHGSKGRESAHGLLLLTPQHELLPEEARVLYVGLSRAKERFDVRTFCGTRWRHLEDSARAWHPTLKTGNQRVEVGRAGDFDLPRTLTTFGGELEAQQRVLATFDGRVRKVHVGASEATGWVRHATQEGDTTPLAALSLACVDDLQKVARRRDQKAYPPNVVRHLRWFDLGSAGVTREAAMKFDLPDPWGATRLFLMPVILGPGVIFGAKQ
jgi:hypothetical protein